MNKRPIYLNPKAYTLSAIIIGYALIGDYTANQQNAIGNWFMTIGQILECNSAIQQTIEAMYQGNTYNINSKSFKNGGSAYMGNSPLDEGFSPDQQEIKDIKEMLQNILKRLEELEK